MLYRVSCILLYLLTFFHYNSIFVESSSSKENDKLPENAAFQMCIESFDIHKDKIIRTQDSQEMGAKYLNEVDLDSRQECLRLCCETDECDVFIFEEKKPGSCYLFHCGPPHDFKCKFTNHANYSSAVLTNINYRSTAQLEEQIRRTQQEHELKSLRKLAEPARLEYAYTEAPPVLVTEAPKTSVVTTPVSIKTGCSRNQYECRTSRDCIAIYNVCDGIPQCADGSDEASELGCPTEKPTIPSSPVINVPLIPQTSQVLKYPDILPHHKNYPPLYGNEQEIQQKLWPLPVPPHQIISQQPNVPYPGQQGAMSLPQINYGSQGYIGGWDYRQAIYEQNKDAYNSVNQMHPKNEVPPYDQGQPRIFKHKSAGVVSDVGAPEGSSYVDSNRPFNSYHPAQNHGVWQEGQQPQAPVQPPQPSPSPPVKVQHKPTASREQLKSTTGPLPCKPTPKNTEDVPKITSGEKKEQEPRKIPHEETVKSRNHISKAVIHESSQGLIKEARIDKSQTSDRETQHSKNLEQHHDEVRIHHFVAEHLQQNNHRVDSDILRPKGAVISLALGLTATAIMAALIACRLRVVRRRGRRGHGPYAHDADYLVNGMYL